MPEAAEAAPRLLAAQVVLNSAPVDAQSAVAARHSTPAAGSTSAATQAFAALGFRVGPVVGHSFSIEALARQFESSFGLAIERQADGSIVTRADPATPLSELPLHRLPPALRAAVRSVLFSKPPDFGPTTMP